MDIFKIQGLGQTKPPPLIAHPFPFNHLVSSLNPLGSSSPKKPWGTSLPPPPIPPGLNSQTSFLYF